MFWLLTRLVINWVLPILIFKPISCYSLFNAWSTSWDSFTSSLRFPIIFLHMLCNGVINSKGDGVSPCLILFSLLNFSVSACNLTLAEALCYICLISAAYRRYGILVTILAVFVGLLNRKPLRNRRI